jgi:hypothetical protein
MALQTFTAGQILTAAQVTALQANDYNQTVSTKTDSYVLVAADKGTRVVMNKATATTITVNTSLFTAGDSLRLQNIGSAACVLTAGTATVTSAGPLSIPQWGGGQLYFTSASAAVYFPDAVTASPSGLVCVKAETAFSAATTITADSIFSSSYTNYVLLIQYYNSGNTEQNLTLQLRASGVTATASNYSTQDTQNVITTAAASRSAGASSVRIGTTNDANYYTFSQTTFYQPQLAAVTGFQTQFNWNNGATYSQPISNTKLGNHSLSTAYDGFILTQGGGFTVTGSYAVYGYSKTV